jgi:cytochrome c5
MTLANMRANGVRSLSVTCEVCHHEAVMNVDAFGEATAVPAFGPR